ncbi:hypothetical protein P9173_09520 [Bacillus safensis]|uniref:hypothetical protein n=1 Tax=Bacillus TaxID=1386 RepID=UPI0011A7DCD0|nr:MULTISPECIES: hypothetical protein [Bacillus]MCY7542460.1 hypothetical protein [Bacillus safensis]MCY7552579.1 hypothetical protein [Bacillus safensis]MCY7644766.1 hypothetical protein [Bacillus safensis]MCY7655919.1 hypothetical protein [Bacillus safensis]MEC3710394.1 hypothetical protein [Bacillus safensis]
MTNKIYVIRIDVAYAGEFIVIPHTNKKSALADFYNRIKWWEDNLKVTSKKLSETKTEIEVDVRDPISEEGASLYFNVVESAEELVL